MPNTPVSIGKGVSALCCNSSVSVENREEAERIFNSVGSTYWIQENSFDLYTALIGSGPAYIFYLLESLRKVAKELNVEQSKIEKLILEMVIGSAKLARDSAEDPESLRKKVTSPGGVTEKAIEVLEDNDEIIKESVQVSQDQSLDYFGYNIFNRDPQSFQTSTFGAIDPNYNIGPGDEIIVMLWGESQFRQ